MEELLAGDLRIKVARHASGEPLTLSWHGKSNDRHPGKILLPYLTKALTEAASSGTRVELRFEELEHFNSSTITALIQVIQESRQRGVGLVFVHDANLKWQKLSFDALRVFAKDGLLEIKTVRES